MPKSDGWRYFPELPGSDAIVCSPGIGKQRAAASIEDLGQTAYKVPAFSKNGREDGLLLKSDGLKKAGRLLSRPSFFFLSVVRGRPAGPPLYPIANSPRR